MRATFARLLWLHETMEINQMSPVLRESIPYHMVSQKSWEGDVYDCAASPQLPIGGKLLELWEKCYPILD